MGWGGQGREAAGTRAGFWEGLGGSVGTAVPFLLSPCLDMARVVHGGCQG